ncbi:hypothetical protein ACH4E7_30635 [Kitasatospora sp. NPDC018058]|uniref:hypothetical protein n=1 Tax=Kitasatospora sp. NPDC018058 TaxID=3364025 RepID=UPI0037BECE57
MSVTAVQSVPTALFLEPAATERSRHRVQELLDDYRAGAWSPTALERRVAATLLTATEADGELTAGQVRAALWDGAVTMIQENHGRFASALADLVPVLDETEPTAPEVVDAAAELVAAVADLD